MGSCTKWVVMEIGFSVSLLLGLIPLLSYTNGFCNAPSQTFHHINPSLVTMFGYVPDGFTAESYKKFKENEAKKKKANLGKMGPKGFKSRSFQSFQEALERGEATHLMPVFNAKEKVKRGQLREEDIPYMQRGGAWDNSDVKGAKRVKWGKSDKEYASGGYRKSQSVSIFGEGPGLDWTGSRGRAGPPAQANGKAQSGQKSEQPKKKLFGLF